MQLVFLVSKNGRLISLSSVRAWLWKDKGILQIQLSQIIEISLCALQVHSLNWILIPHIKGTGLFILKSVQYFLTLSSEREKKKKVGELKNLRTNNLISWLFSSFLFFSREILVFWTFIVTWKKKKIKWIKLVIMHLTGGLPMSP